MEIDDLVRLVSPNVASQVTREERMWGELSDDRRNELTWHFVYAMYYNDPPFAIEDVSMVDVLKEGEREEASWVWRVVMRSRGEWMVVGWCDYTGWDCQSGAAFYKRV